MMICQGPPLRAGLIIEFVEGATEDVVLADLEDVEPCGSLDKPQDLSRRIENGPKRSRSLFTRNLVFADPEVIRGVGHHRCERRHVLRHRCRLELSAQPPSPRVCVRGNLRLDVRLDVTGAGRPRSMVPSDDSRQ